MREELTSARILIVDDEEANVRLLDRMLRREGYTDLVATTDPREVPDLFSEATPDLILLDLRMPHLDGVELIERLRPAVAATTYLPILVLTADASPEAMQRALSAGAMDFVTKPFERTEVLLRIRNLLETRRLHLQLEGVNERLEERVVERTRELRDARNETLERLAMAAEHRDDDTAAHIRRVGTLSMLVAQGLALPGEQIELLARAAPLHDVGKLGISDQILLKPARLTPEEFDHVKTHSAIGAEILAASSIPVLRMAEEIAMTHHERWDGTGYPTGLRGEEIPLTGRIVAIADVFDALTHERPYKHAWPIEEAVDEIIRQRERHFDPDVVDAFLAIGDGLLTLDVAWETPGTVRIEPKGADPAGEAARSRRRPAV